MKVSVLQAGKEWFVCLVQGVQSFEICPRYEDTPHESGKMSAEWSASMLRKAIEAHNAELLEADDLKGPEQ